MPKLHRMFRIYAYPCILSMVLFFSGLIFPVSAFADKEPLVFAFFTRGWLPMEMMTDNEPSGAAVDIFEAVMSPMFNTSVVPTNRPRKLLYTEARPAYTRLTAKEWLSTEYQYLFSDPVMPLTNVMYSSARRPLEYSGPESLLGKTIGCIKNYTYPRIELLVAAGKVKRYDVNTIPVLLRMVKEGRVDGAILDMGEAQWGIRNMSALSPEDFHVAAQPVDEVQLRFVFSRTPGFEERLPEINARIKVLRESGAVDKILSRYQ